MLVPRKMSISPLESWLTVRYSLPKGVVINVHNRLGYEPVQQYDLPPRSQGSEQEQEQEEGGKQNRMECKNVLKIRRRKMNKHKHKKLMKRTRFLRKKVKEGRRRRKQVIGDEGQHLFSTIHLTFPNPLLVLEWEVTRKHQ